MVPHGAPGGVRDRCPMTAVPMNIHSVAAKPVRTPVGFFIVSSSTGILMDLAGIGKGKEGGRLTPQLNSSKNSINCPLCFCRTTRGVLKIIRPVAPFTPLPLWSRPLESLLPGYAIGQKTPIDTRGKETSPSRVRFSGYQHPSIN